jgi:hypothetical protein
MTVIRRSSIRTILAVSLLLGSTAAGQAEDKVLGLFGDWGAQTFTEGKNTGCSIWSQPTKSAGKYSKRGAIYAYVTHRPWDKRINEVSFSTGYEYKDDSTVQALIGGQKFTLFTDGETAWSRSAKDDKALVDAMKRGATMVVTGISSRGTKTTDTYSLTGFTKAYQTIGKACNVK